MSTKQIFGVLLMQLQLRVLHLQKICGYLKSTALNLWLLGFEFPETIMVFMKKQIHILCSQKKASILESVKKSAREAVDVDVQSLIGHDASTVGYISREAPEGKLLEAWSDKLKNSNFHLSDVANGLSILFAVKSNEELTSIKRAAYLTTSVMKNFVVSKLENVIDEEKKVSHSTLMEETEKVILEPSKVNCKLKADNVDICYPPIFQSGGEFDLRPSAVSNDELLHYDSASVIICAVGARYKSYCSNIARTFLIDAEPLQSKAYEVLLKAHEAVIGSLKPGNKLSAAIPAAVSIVEKDAPDLVSNLTKSAGTGIGIEFRESGLNLNAKNEQIIKEGMVFNVSIGFQNLQSEKSKSKNKLFSLLLADTVIINKDKTEVVTSMSSKALKDVAYSFNEEEEEEKPSRKADTNGAEPVISKTTLRSDNHEISKEELRRQHQAELARQKNEETARRLAGGGNETGDNRSSVRTSAELVAYKNINDLPPPREMMIQIDQKNEAVLLPINGSMDMVQNVGGGKRSAYDPDELEEEQRERERKNKINVEFQSFVNRVNDLWGQPQFNGLDLEFDQPLRGTWLPWACLVELIETPFLVVTLSEIEIVNLERVGLGQTNFDMTIVFKDFKRDVLRIDSIPSTSLDGIKEWLGHNRHQYYESRLNLNWRQILKTITDDPQSFIEGGGWEFLNWKLLIQNLRTQRSQTKVMALPI
ncbi:PH-like domain superfamily [Sesbania bispinosa]|nr:PH-like domain superfamily [Sesbania bispinosa]